MVPSLTDHVRSSITLYHRTSPEAAAQIRQDAAMISKEASGNLFFSTHPDEAIAGYGQAVVRIRIPRSWIDLGKVTLDDEFELDDGTYEEHYAVPACLLQPWHFI